MNSVEEIEQAIERLPAADVARLQAWLSRRDNEAWDRQMEADAASGKLDFLFEEGREDDTLRDWPPNK
jgi:hypothetical protein